MDCCKIYLWPTCTMILLRSVDLNWLWLAGRFLWEIKSVKLVWWSSGLCLQCVHLGVLSISLSILDITRYWHNTRPGHSHLPPTNLSSSPGSQNRRQISFSLEIWENLRIDLYGAINLLNSHCANWFPKLGSYRLAISGWQIVQNSKLTYMDVK